MTMRVGTTSRSSTSQAHRQRNRHRHRQCSRGRSAHAHPLRCTNSSASSSSSSSSGLNVFQRAARVLKEKASADVSRLLSAGEKTRSYNANALDEIFAMWKLDEASDVLEDLEDALIAADLGYDTAADVVTLVKDKVKSQTNAYTAVDEKNGLRKMLRDTVVSMLPEQKEGDAVSVASTSRNADAGEDNAKDEMRVVLVCGVNGAGKTTTLGKLAHLFRESGLKVMLVPCDTFRAAASSQLEEWARRSGAEMSHGTCGGCVAVRSINASLSVSYSYVLPCAHCVCVCKGKTCSA